MNRKGYFICFEGIDGSGKSTQAALLASAMKARGIDCVSLAEPSDGAYGLEIRKMLSKDSLPAVERQVELFILDRADDAQRNIMPALSTGKTVIIDRYYFSNAAYQGAMGLDCAFILEENRKRSFPEPDIVFLIDVSPEEALERIKSRSGITDTFEKKEFLAKVRNIFLQIADPRFVLIDGMQKTEDIHHVALTNIRQAGFNI
ncbi:MAG: dTMP kinase [Leptospirales bacterium]|nr:dTMP kinase [Leptospirales bacterium]